LERLLESVEASMHEDIYDAIPPELAAASRVDVNRGGDCLRLTARGFDHPMFNRVISVGLGSPDPEDAAFKALAQAEAHYRAAGVRRWMLQVLPSVESRRFRAAAAERGIVRLRGWAKHLGPSSAPVQAASDLQVIQVAERRHAVAWARIVVEAFSLPPDFVPWFAALAGREGWFLYLALDGETPVASGALHLVDRDGARFGQLSFAGTRRSHRGRGAQSALVARRVADAAAMGAAWIVAETDEELPDRPNPSYHNLVRLGFPVAYVRANWGPPKPGE
jgi:GNAT superfamily N-acetyltransferase